MFLRIFGRIVGYILPWESIIGVLLEIAVRLLQDWLSGKPFTKKAKYFVMGVYVFAEGIGEELALDTRTTIDDDSIKHVKTLCQQIAGEQNFKLPIVEEL